MTLKSLSLASLVVPTLFLAGCGGSAGPAGQPGPADPDGARPAPRRGDPEERSYTDIVDENAVSDAGLFTVHEVDDDYYFEIPDSLLERDMLLVSRISGVQAGMGGFLPAGAAVNRQMVRFERRDDRILLRRYSGEAMADDTLAIALSVESNYFAPILASFDVEARAPSDSATVIDVTDL